MHEYTTIITPDGIVWELRTGSAQVRAYVRNGAGYIGGGTQVLYFQFYEPPQSDDDFAIEQEAEQAAERAAGI